MAELTHAPKINKDYNSAKGQNRGMSSKVLKSPEPVFEKGH